MIFTVEFFGNKGWEIGRETDSYIEALSYMKLTDADGYDSRLTISNGGNGKALDCIDVFAPSPILSELHSSHHSILNPNPSPVSSGITGEQYGAFEGNSWDSKESDIRSSSDW